MTTVTFTVTTQLDTRSEYTEIAKLQLASDLIAKTLSEFDGDVEFKIEQVQFN
jgi:hypothetical protein